MAGTFKDIVKRANHEGPKKLVLVQAGNKKLIECIFDAEKAGLISPIFLGDGGLIEKGIGESSRDAGNYEIIDEKDPGKSLSLAATMVKDNRAHIVMQGDISPASVVDFIGDRENGLLEKRIASFISLYQLVTRDKLIMVTDTYINDFPSLADKIAIIENAIDLARVLRIESPKIAALTAIEQINPSIPSTLDAAVLSKMSERNQFGGVTIEGPLDIDCALSQRAATRKGVDSIVTGNVDIYVTPHIEAGYSLSQLLVFIGHMAMAGVVMGTSCPVILDLPYVPWENKVLEIAVAVLLSKRGHTHE